MTLINSTLLLGLILAAIPVVLHLVMRAKPKRIEFPALRLLQARQPSNARRMQIRHVLLLLLRTLLIAMLVLAVARPSLPAARYGLRWWEWLILACVIGGSVAVWALLTRSKRATQTPSFDAREKHTRIRLWCVVGGLLAAVLAVGVPWGVRVRAELTSPRNEASESVPVAAVFVIDTSISMKYRHENRTRLEYARDAATQHLGRLPAGSRAAISGVVPSEDIIFQADLAGAASRLDSLEVTAVPESLNRRLKAAIQAQIDDRKRVQEEAGTGGSTDLFAREIYLFSDLSRTAWQEPDESGIADAMQQNDWLQIYVVDVSVANPVNASITGLKLSDETSVAGRDLLLTMDVATTSGTSDLSTVETLLVDQSGVETRFGAPQIVRTQNGSARIQTTVRIAGDTTFLQGMVRLTTEDPLADDNVRFFSCGVRSRPKVLLISDQTDDSLPFRYVYTPVELEKLGTPYSECTSTTTAQAGQQSFSGYDAVFLINCARPDETLWNNLLQYVQSGGGVFVVAGSNRIQSEAWNTPAARQFLPAAPIRSVPFRTDPGRLQTAADQHPLIRDFLSVEGAAAELTAIAFDRRWAVELNAGASVLMEFNGQGIFPALMEKKTGQGICLLFASAMDNRTRGGSQWNNLVTSWSFVLLAEESLQHLTGVHDFQRNFTAGQAIDLAVPAGQRFEQFLLRRPGLRQTRDSMPADEDSLLLTDAVDPGHYRVKPFESASPFEAAFSVNFRDEETDLTRLSDDVISQLVGKERVSIVHNLEELERAVRVGRLGVEIFPVLMGLIIFLFCAEHLMANFFYDADSATRSATSKTGAQPA